MVAVLVPGCAFFLVELHGPERRTHARLKKGFGFCKVHDVNRTFSFIIVSHSEIKPLHFALPVRVVAHEQVIYAARPLTRLVKVCALKAGIENHVVFGLVDGLSHLIGNSVNFFQIYLVCEATLPRSSFAVTTEALTRHFQLICSVLSLGRFKLILEGWQGWRKLEPNQLVDLLVVAGQLSNLTASEDGVLVRWPLDFVVQKCIFFEFSSFPDQVVSHSV